MTPSFSLALISVCHQAKPHSLNSVSIEKQDGFIMRVCLGYHLACLATLNKLVFEAKVYACILTTHTLTLAVM